MKILAIRGRNLASLAGDFAIEFEAPPLAGAGLFAIVGPTGAGKSTILDALCLALFDRTPRLSDHGGVLVGLKGEAEGNRLKSEDVRSILSRGAASGHAEVEFLGGDRRRYRARWSVRRARDRVTGAFQSQTMTLHEVATGRPIGTKKTEVLAAIREKLGLSFDQFRRSALLAQGDFATFLLANETERASLLEQMTGTELYSHISRSAFERASQERRVLDAMKERMSVLSVLSAEARESLDAALASAGAEATGARSTVTALEAAERWYDMRRRLRSEVATADGTNVEALGVWDALAEDRERLEASQRAQSVVASIHLADEAARRLDDTANEVASWASTAEERAKAREVAVRAFASATCTLEAERAAAKAREAEVVDAMKLDAEVVAAKGQSETTATVACTSRAAATEAEREATKIKQGLDDALARHRDAEQSLAKLSRFSRLAAEWERWQGELRRYQTAAAAISAVDPTALKKGIDVAQNELRLATKALGRHEAAFKAAETVLAKGEQKLAAIDLDALRKERAAAIVRRKDLDALTAACSEVARLREEIVDLEREAVDADTEAVAAEEAREEAKTSAAKVQVHIETTEEALLALRAALGLEEHRAELEDGKECPLCGSLDHPWSGRSAPSPKAAEKLEKAARDLREEHQRLTKRDASETAKREAALKRASAARNKAAKTVKLFDSAGSRCGSVAKRLGLALPAGPSIPKGFQARLGRLEADLSTNEADIVRREARAEKCQDHCKNARNAVDDTRVLVERGHRRVQAIQKSLDEATRALDEGSAALERALMARGQAEEDVSPGFDDIPGWRVDLAADPTSFVAVCWRNVRSYREAAKIFGTAKDAASALQPKLDVATECLKVAAERAARDEDTARACAEAHHVKRRERSALLDGQPTTSFVEGQRRRLERAEAEANGARDKTVSSERVVVDAVAKREAAAGAHVTAQDGRLQAERTRDEQLRAVGLSLDGARELLGLGAGWLAESTARVAAARKACDTAIGVLGERRLKLRAHGATTPPTEDEATLPELLATARGTVETADARLFELRRQAKNDDDARKHLQEREGEYASREAASRKWTAVNDLIGSADGKRFRIFAQSLTFDALLAQANVHLADINRRYSLMRVPETDLELQVIDHDMGDEIRGVTSLSGGESFLVSLALALGLSTLGGHRARVDSLFIDEGFGSLDPETLEIAVASLESLQASGCQVGVISHVTGLAERFTACVQVERRRPGKSVLVIAGLARGSETRSCVA